MKHLPQRRKGLVGGHQRGPALQVPDADDAEEHVSGIRQVALVAQLVDDEHVRMDVGLQGLLELAPESHQREGAVSAHRRW